ncbi:MAG: putative O-glycosylation ligase, exosortase A system-associated [Massilia sp.]
MRDMFFLAILPLMLFLMAKRPFIAVGMWIWTAMFFPNAWMYGIASGIRYNLIFTAIAFLGYLVYKNKPKVHFGTLGALILLFFLWTTLSTAMTEGVPEVAWDIWQRFFKVILLFLIVVLVIDKKLHIDFFLGCVVLSIGFFASVEGLKYIASAGGHKIEGFYGHVLGDRNELALAFVITLPICSYLLAEYGKQYKWIRLGLLGVMALLVTAIVGTNSRGGFVALLGLAGYFFMKSDRKILLSVLALILVAVLSQFVSAEWSSRMNTINDASGDASFMGRVVAWKLSFIQATRHPFFGGGFKTLEYFPMWRSLSSDFFSFPFFYTGDVLPDETHGHAAHSVYFQVLGEHGFAGLAIYLAMLVRAFTSARKVGRIAKQHVETQWVAAVALMLQLCIFAFCLGGAALSFAYFELMFAMYGMVVVLETRILPRLLQKIAAKGAANDKGSALPQQDAPLRAARPA